MRSLAVGLVLVLGACGGGSKSSDGGGGSGGSGTGTGGGGGGGAGGAAGDCNAMSMITVSGALTGTRTAPAAASSWGTSNDTGVVTVSAQFGGPFLSSWSFTFTGEPQVTTYTDATAGVQCAVTAAEGTDGAASTTSGWLAAKGVQTTPDQGSCSLTLTSVTTTLMISTQKQYCVHGSVQATLPAQPGSTSTGTVMLTATF